LQKKSKQKEYVVIIENSLLPTDIEQIPMRLEDNISYIEYQEKMIEIYIEGLKNTISNRTTWQYQQ